LQVFQLMTKQVLRFILALSLNNIHRFCPIKQNQLRVLCEETFNSSKMILASIFCVLVLLFAQSAYAGKTLSLIYKCQIF